MVGCVLTCIKNQQEGPHDLRELAFQLSAITLLPMPQGAKDRLRREFAAALEEVGADSAKAALEGEEIAKVSLIQPRIHQRC